MRARRMSSTALTGTRVRTESRIEPTESLLERDAALEAGQLALDSAALGAGSLLAIAGPAGVGRSALLEALGARAAASGAVPLRARCAEGEQRLPYGTVLQLFEQYVADLGEREVASVFSGRARLAGRLLTAEDGRDPEATPEEPGASLTLIHSLYRLTANLASKAPVTLVVDDLQWADPESLRFLLYLTPRLADISASLLVSVRDGAQTESAGDVSELIGAHHARVERLTPLGEDSVRELVLRRLGTCSRQSAGACHWLTGGNPMLVQELIGAAEESGLDVAFAAEICERAPDRVRHRVLGQIGRMPAGALAVARAAAVLQSASSRRRIATMTELADESLTKAISALERAGILDCGDPVEYVHPLVRAAVYSQIPAEERARLHGRAAIVLRGEEAAPDAVAAHLLRTRPDGQHWVVDELWRAARAARQNGEFDRAVGLLRRALDEPPGADAQGRVLVELGRLEIDRGEIETALATLRRAAEISREPERGAAALELGRALYLHGNAREAADLLDRAIEESGLERGRERNELEAAWLAAALIDPALRPEAGRRIERMNGVEAQADSPSLLATVACHLALTGGSRERAVELADLALADPSIHRQPAGFAAALQALCWSGEIDRAGVAVAELAVHASVERSRRALASVRLAGAHSSHLAGRLHEAESDAGVASTMIGDGLCSDYFDSPRARLAAIMLDRGEVELAEGTIAKITGAPYPEDSPVGAHVLALRSRIHAARHRDAEALDDALEAGRLLLAAGIENPAVCAWRSQAAVAASKLGDRDRAERLAREEVDLARRFGAAPAIGVALTGAGRIASGKQAVDLLTEAAEVLDQSGARLEHARTLTYLGAALRHHGSQKQARETLRRALDAATRLGAEQVSRRARSELRLAGARPRGTTTIGPAALTAAERRVTDLAAIGLTNREISEELYVTKKTVEWHLHNAFRKLDVQSRAELAEVLGAEAEAEVAVAR